ncbi:hypothetical protein BDY19DRAFT_915777 [Irpex rosettiformis]|uniref:Uncharacterized protein n=1 Tax=Irpex rosettiformis TaxID=378272 RepID=A0ACB8ULA1_9APHY|nr:hypothetical protein BDY19DRAFT_915777 [Irpex rosettiformis]
MSDHPTTALISHPPAQKVAGRRMSMTTRPKPHLHSLEHRVASGDGDDEDEDEDDAPVDYPRPAPPGESAQEEHHHKNDKSKGEKKHDPNYGRKAQETLRKKADHNRPAIDPSSGSSAPGVRVNQPSKRLSL